MKGQQKTKEELGNELVEMRKRICYRRLIRFPLSRGFTDSWKLFFPISMKDVQGHSSVVISELPCSLISIGFLGHR
jgi:hypothetical protein